MQESLRNEKSFVKQIKVDPYIKTFFVRQWYLQQKNVV